MAGQTVKSGLAAKYGSKLNTAVAKHTDDPTDYGNIQLPGGIKGGVAKLVECKFDTYKSGDYKGEYYFRAAGVVVEPKSVPVNGKDFTVEGLQTSVMIPVCDTKTQAGKVTSQEENIAKILNEMRKLGASTEGIGADELESVAAALKEAAPYFRFSTSQSQPTSQFPDPRVWENWYGTKGLEDYVPPENSDETEDNTQEEEPSTPPPAPAKPKPAASAPPQKPPVKTKPVPEPEPEEFNELETAEDLEQLASLADEQDESAIEKLTQLALEAGVSQDDVDNADNWTTVVEMIQSAGDGSDTSKPAEEEFVPVKGDVYKYAPIDPATKKPLINAKTKKPIVSDVEVIGIDEKKKTASLKNLSDGKSLKGVPWDQLTPAAE